MKAIMKIESRLAIFSMLFPCICFAGQPLALQCQAGDLSLLKNVHLQNYNVMYSYEDQTDRMNVRFDMWPEFWFSVEHLNPKYSSLFEMAKLARLTGEEIDVCVNTKGGYLVGLEWSRGPGGATQDLQKK